MGIPESQLETWSHQGSIQQSSSTYNSIKNVLMDPNAPYSGKSFKIFLQGSYGNDTNIYSESDVDIVIQTDDVFYKDLSLLSEDQKKYYDGAFPAAPYSIDDFKREVIQQLKNKYGSDAVPGEKAVTIASNGNRRKADIIIAAQYRRYHRFNGMHDQRYDEGITFWTSSGSQIINFPKQHSENMTSKHQSTNTYLKPMVRILKNARGKLISNGAISKDTAPSYYLEGLLYNVPREKFVSSYNQTLFNCLEWLESAEKSSFVCANEQYYLFWENSPVSWRLSKFQRFYPALVNLWNKW